MRGSEAAEAAPATEAFPEIWGQVPQRNKNFTGRDTLLAQLRDGITSDVTAVLPHALHGLGGVGKTQVAIEYAYRYRSAYDVVWWIPADQPALVQSSLAALAPRLLLPPATATGIQDAADAVLDALRRGQPYSRWLLIFDNADQPEDLNELVPRGPGHVLITSRNHRWQGVVDSVLVDVFSRAESVEFLTKRVPKAISSTAADLLAKELGDLPLALEQAGALQAETGMPTQEYLQLLGQQTRDLLAESKPSEYPVSMTAAWRISVAKLTDSQPAALELLRCCAFFGPEPIPRDVFRRGVPATGSHLSQVLSDPILLARAIRDLGRFALASIDPTTRTIQVHRLIQALLRDDLSSEEQRKFRHEVHLLLAGATPGDPNDEGQWPRFSELVAHIGPARVTESREPGLRKFALNMVRYLFRSGAYAPARAFVEACIKQWSADSGPDDPDVIAAQRNLGDVLRDQGRYRAAYDLTGPTLDRARRVLGVEHDVTLALATGFGADLRARGDFAAARDIDEESVLRLETTLDPLHPRTLRARNNLALDFCLISNYTAARDLLQRTYMEQSQASTGVSKVDVLSSWSDLSRVVRLAGKYTEARLLAEDAYEFGRQELGAEHPWTLRTGKELSIALRMAGESAEGVELARDLLKQFEQVLGKDHPDALAAATNLANALRTIGEVDEAFVIAEEMMTRYPRVYTADHPYLHACAGNLALLRRLHDDPAGARELDEESLAKLNAKLGHDHDYPLTVATNLASDLAALGEVQAARELGEDVLVRLRAVLGMDHPAALGCAVNLVLDLRADGAHDRAAELADDTYSRLVRAVGSEHRDAKAAMLGQRLEFDFDPPPF